MRNSLSEAQLPWDAFPPPLRLRDTFYDLLQYGHSIMLEQLSEIPTTSGQHGSCLGECWDFRQ